MVAPPGPSRAGCAVYLQLTLPRHAGSDVRRWEVLAIVGFIDQFWSTQAQHIDLQQVFRGLEQNRAEPADSPPASAPPSLPAPCQPAARPLTARSLSRTAEALADLHVRLLQGLGKKSSVTVRTSLSPLASSL